jgi:hypothetical protein
MKVDIRLWLEVTALAAIIVAVFLATGKVWAGLLTFAASMAYIAYVWQIDPVTIKRPSLKGLRRNGNKKPAS